MKNVFSSIILCFFIVAVEAANRAGMGSSRRMIWRLNAIDDRAVEFTESGIEAIIVEYGNDGKDWRD
jgi:hypothetical protein